MKKFINIFRRNNGLGSMETQWKAEILHDPTINDTEKEEIKKHMNSLPFDDFVKWYYNWKNNRT